MSVERQLPLDRRAERLQPQGEPRTLEAGVACHQHTPPRPEGQIRHVVHTLKSSSASIGALALARLCAEIETSIRAEAFAALPDRLDAMDRELAAVLQAVSPMLSTSGTPT